MKTIHQIGVIGASDATPEERKIAERVGALIAERGAVLVCGGRGGVMEAACQGARSKGGNTVGILMGESQADRNAYVDIAIPTGMGHARNVIVVYASEVIIAIGGSFGTLSELAYAMKHRIPVVGLGTWEASAPRAPWDVHIAQTAEEAVEVAFQKLTLPRLVEMPSNGKEESVSPFHDVH